MFRAMSFSATVLEVRPTSRFCQISQSAELLVKLSPRTVADQMFRAMSFSATVLEVRPTSRFLPDIAVARTSSQTVASDRGRPNVPGDEFFGHGPRPGCDGPGTACTRRLCRSG